MIKTKTSDSSKIVRTVGPNFPSANRQFVPYVTIQDPPPYILHFKPPVSIHQLKVPGYQNYDRAITSTNLTQTRLRQSPSADHLSHTLDTQTRTSTLVATALIPLLHSATRHTRPAKEKRTIPHQYHVNTMVAHLHPRSRSTLSLFTTCLTISFLVVGAPHILPCPVDRRQYSEDGSSRPSDQPKRRRRRKSAASSDTSSSSSASDTGIEDEGDTQENVVTRPGRECPVPKPGGLIGQVMGFEKREKRTATTTTVLVDKMREGKRNGEFD